MAAGGFQQLATWRQAMDLTQRLFALTEYFPAEERSGLTGTLRRVGPALAAKLAEVSAYNDPAKLRDTWQVARGTLREIQTYLLLAQRLRYARAWGLWRLQRAINKLDATLQREIAALAEVSAAVHPPTASPAGLHRAA
jgi:four helix bundle protein